MAGLEIQSGFQVSLASGFLDRVAETNVLAHEKEPLYMMCISLGGVSCIDLASAR